jgi:integrase
MRRCSRACFSRGCSTAGIDELKAAWEAADALEPAYAGFLKLLILTGQRLREVSEMEWKEIDLNAKLWTLPGKRAKNGVEHTIPLSDLAAEILKALPRIDGSSFVFTINGRNPIRGTHQTKRRIDKLAPEIAPWVLHDIRRTVASGMARLGINLPVIEKLLNHVRHVEQLVSGEAAAYVVELAKARG